MPLPRPVTGRRTCLVRSTIVEKYRHRIGLLSPGCPWRFEFRLSAPMSSREVPAERFEHLHLVNLLPDGSPQKLAAWISFPVPDLRPSASPHPSSSSGACVVYSPLPCPSIPESIPYLIRFENDLQPGHDDFLR